MNEIAKRVNQAIASKSFSEIALIRKDQVGSGMRSDKRRTLRFQNNTVIDHITGKKTQADRYMKGFIDELWE